MSENRIDVEYLQRRVSDYGPKHEIIIVEVTLKDTGTGTKEVSTNRIDTIWFNDGEAAQQCYDLARQLLDYIYEEEVEAQ